MTPALILAALLATPLRELVVLEGNVVLPDELYYAVIDRSGLAHTLGASSYEADRLAREIRSFLRESGYEIAEVWGEAVDGHIRLTIDEGRLTRVLYRGHGDFRTIQIKLAVSIPQNVFNRPAIERQLEALRHDLGITEIDMELVPTRVVDHAGPQLEDVGTLAGVPILPPSGRYELRITLGQKEWGTGIGVHIDIKDPDGVRIGTSYSSQSLFFDNDRWQLRVDLGANQFTDLVDHGTFVDVSRAFLDWIWITPPLLGLRPSFTTTVDYRARGRPDIDVQLYRWFQFGMLGSIGYDFTEGIHVRLGAGFETRSLFDIQEPLASEGEAPIPSSDEILGRINAHGVLVFDPDNVRLDMRHVLDLDAQLLVGADHNPRWVLRGEYQKFFALGWHDVLIRSRALGAWGHVRFSDEESLAWLLRGAFGSSHWFRRGVGLTGEFRLSITRDVFKAGVFADGAVFEKPGRGREPTEIMGGFVAGPGLHILLFDIFQFDFFYSFGVLNDGLFEHGFSMSARKAF